METLFWLCTAIVLYTYLGYPLLLALLCKLRRVEHLQAPFRGSVSIVMVAYNEEVNVARRLGELLELLDTTQVDGKVVLVSDGSTDRTVAVARRLAGDPRVRILDLEQNVGKAAALTAGCEIARGEVLVFADARQRWAPDSLSRLLENFADPAVGAVSGNLVLESSLGVMAGVGLYWRYEKWLRKQESELYAQVGVTGAICAVRREHFQPIPAGTLLDDVYWPLQVAMQGKRVVFEDRAVAYDRLPSVPLDEFRRKVRTLAGNFQLLGRFPAALIPWKNPVWFQFVSHKLMRLAVPWALLGMLVASLCQLDSAFFQLALCVQLAAYGLAILGLANATHWRLPLASTAASFLVLNAAAFLGFWVWLTGRAGQSWRKIAYHTQSAGASTQAPATG